MYCQRFKNKKVIGTLITVSLLLMIVGICLAKKNDNKSYQRYGDTSSSTKITYNYAKNEKVKFIRGVFSDKIINSSDDVVSAIGDIKDLIGIKNPEKELILDNQQTSEDMTYYRYNQIYNQIPVLDQNIVVSVNKDKKAVALSGYYIPNISVETTPQKSQEEMEKTAEQNLGENAKIQNIELAIWAEYDNQKLVYVVDGYSSSKAVRLIMDAKTGEKLSEVDGLESVNTYPYTGLGIDDIEYTINLEEYFEPLAFENAYRFHDPERNISIVDARMTGQITSALISIIPIVDPITVNIVEKKIDTSKINEEFVKDAITAMANYEKIYDYYNKILGRNSYDNKGGKIQINLGVGKEFLSKEDLNNAFWFSVTNQMYIGNMNGKSLAASLDALAHEFTHGVISYTSKFANQPKKDEINQAFETGALNEGYADIMGSLIEGKNWTIAENNGTIRDAESPEDYELPSIKGGTYYYPDGYLSDDMTLEEFLESKGFEKVIDYDKGGIHRNSNVVSHAAYLMYKDGAFKSREEMAKVWYNSLFLLSSYADFEDCALAIIETAKNMNLKEDAIYKITKAFTETKMLEEETYNIKGTIKSGTEPLENVEIQFYSYDDNKFISSIKSDKTGFYEQKIPMGIYKVKVLKEGFNNFEEIITINGEMAYDILLAQKTKEMSKKNVENTCTAETCYNFTVYFIEANKSNKAVENYKTYRVNAGTTPSSKMITDSINKSFGSNLLTSDGKSFYMDFNGFEVEFAWYYKDSDEIYQWNTPINKDVAIEMKLFDGLFDNDSFTNIENFFK